MNGYEFFIHLVFVVLVALTLILWVSAAVLALLDARPRAKRSTFEAVE